MQGNIDVPHAGGFYCFLFQRGTAIGLAEIDDCLHTQLREALKSLVGWLGAAKKQVIYLVEIFHSGDLCGSGRCKNADSKEHGYCEGAVKKSGG